MTPMPIIINNDVDTKSYTMECMESPELSDIYKKYIVGEDFTEEEIERLSECVKEGYEIDKTVDTIGCGVFIGLVVLLIVLLIWCIIA